MKVIIGCECSGITRSAFRKIGHDAWSCDLEPPEDGDVHHIQGNLLDVIYGTTRWDLGIFHPPCDFLANSGVQWLWEERMREKERWDNLRKGAAFFVKCYNAPIKRIAVENPIMHKYARNLIGVDQTQIIQPYDFGHGETKATCLWLKNLPPLVPTKHVKEITPKVHREPPGPERKKNRSRSYVGIAKAMAEQWGYL